MNRRDFLLVAAFGTTAFAPPAAGAVTTARRIVSIGGSLTETLIALNATTELVAVDTTSNFPTDVTGPLPKVGYMRQLAAEGILSLKPTDVFALAGSGPVDALKQVQDAGVAVHIVPEGYSAQAIATKIITVGALVGREAAALLLSADVSAQFAKIATGNTAIRKPLRSIFALSALGGKLSVAGKGTAGDAAITLAGAVNVFADIAGYKTATDEAVLAAAPDVIIVMQNAGQPAEEVLKFPSLAETPAGHNKRFVLMDGMYLLGFGPREAAAIVELRAQLYPDVKFEG